MFKIASKWHSYVYSDTSNALLNRFCLINSGIELLELFGAIGARTPADEQSSTNILFENSITMPTYALISLKQFALDFGINLLSWLQISAVSQRNLFEVSFIGVFTIGTTIHHTCIRPNCGFIKMDDDINTFYENSRCYLREYSHNLIPLQRAI